MNESQTYIKQKRLKEAQDKLNCMALNKDCPICGESSEYAKTYGCPQCHPNCPYDIIMHDFMNDISKEYCMDRFPESSEDKYNRLFEAYQNQCLIARQWMEKYEKLNNSTDEFNIKNTEQLINELKYCIKIIEGIFSFKDNEHIHLIKKLLEKCDK